MKYLFIFITIVFHGTYAFGQADSVTQTPKLVLIKNDSSLIPLRSLDSWSIQYPNDMILQEYGSRYSENQGEEELVIAVVSSETDYEGDADILIICGDSVDFDNTLLESSRAIIYTSTYTRKSIDLATQLIFGGRCFSDTLIHPAYGYPEGAGIITMTPLRLSFGDPEEVGLDAKYLSTRLDSIATLAIDSGVAPGIQVLVAKDGMVVFHKTYGFQTYDSLVPVDKNMLYDFASVTKITGALPGLMKLYDDGKFSLDATMGTYLPYFARGNKKNLRYRNVLSHNARLKSWIAYWTTTKKKNGKFKRNTLSTDSTEQYNFKLSDGLYMHKDYKENIYKQIRKSRLNEKPGYVYSGLSFYLFPEIIERLTNQDFEKYMKSTIYEPLGASTITWNPARFYPKNRMIPTEVDTFFRHMPLQGVVHDEGAAMMKGISSNAGLFGTTLDLAKIMQMYLWKGFYGEQLIKPTTLDLFTACHYCNESVRRGLGFDKPVLGNKSDGYAAKDASYQSFGHSGYTGTFTWADPKTGILFVFMSNRVYPTRLNRKLYELNIRPTMHQVVYDARTKD